MAIQTVLNHTLPDLTYPIVLAPMGGVAGGALAAAVSNAGGFGFVGGGYGNAGWLERELALVTQLTQAKWGVGLITWHARPEIVQLALSFKPAAFFLSFGDARIYADAIKNAGCALFCQVQEVAAAREAKALGADFIVAQGTEAGGHGAQRSSLPLVPAVIDAVAPLPVLAAGGIADGRGLAAVLALGAAGAVIGTRFCVAHEALMHPAAKAKLVAAHAEQTVRTKVFDTARGYVWPVPYTGRALRNEFLERWHERDAGLTQDAQELARYSAAAEAGDFDTALVWAGEAVDLVDRIEPAATIVERIGSAAESWLRRAHELVR